MDSDIDRSRKLREADSGARSFSLSLAAALMAMLLVTRLTFGAQPMDDSFTDFEELDLADLLDVKVVTATGYSMELSKAPAVMTVLTREELRQAGAKTLRDALELLPGTTINTPQYGGTQMTIRGIGSNRTEKVKVMLNGHSLNDPQFSSGLVGNFDNFPLDHVERIEVIRGPGSALYGTNAFAAVVNIIMAREHDRNGAHVTSGGGGDRTIRVSGDYYRETPTGYFFVSVLHSGTAGQKLRIAEDVQTYLDDMFRPYRQEFEMATNISVPDASHAPGFLDAWQRDNYIMGDLQYKDVLLSGLYLHKRRGSYLGLSQVLTDGSKTGMDQYFLIAELKDRPFLEGNLDVKFSLDHYYGLINQAFLPENAFLPYDSDDDGVIDVFYLYPDGMRSIARVKDRTFRIGMRWSRLMFGSHRVIIGGVAKATSQHDVRHSANYDPATLEPFESFQDVTAFANFQKRTKRNVYACYFQDNFKIGQRLWFAVGARYDRFSDFGSTVNPRLGISWSLGDDVVAKILYGRAFRAPNFSELYTTNNPLYSGSPVLKPERMENYELNLAAQLSGHLSIEVTGFSAQIRDIISLVEGTEDLGTVTNMAFANSGDFSNQGIEAIVRYGFGKGKYVETNFILQKARDLTLDQRTPYVPDAIGKGRLNWQLWSRLSGNVSIIYTSKLHRWPEDTRADVPPTTVVNLALTPVHSVGGFNGLVRIKNLFDIEYDSPLFPIDIPQPRRELYAEVSYGF